MKRASTTTLVVAVCLLLNTFFPMPLSLATDLETVNVARQASPWVSYYAPKKAYKGYTLFAPLDGSVAWLVDMEGRPVHCWELETPPGMYGKLLPNGNLLYMGQGGVMVEVDWHGHVVWKYQDRDLHHDFYRLDNGNTVVIRRNRVPVPDEIASRVQGGFTVTERMARTPGREWAGFPMEIWQEGKLWADSIREITPAGKVVWEWIAHEHLDPAVDVIDPKAPHLEWTHANSLDVAPNGDVLAHFPRINTLVIIDKATGDIKWRWGPEELAEGHTATLLDNGNILMLDNGLHRRGGPQSFTRVIEINPKTREIVWEYNDTPPHRFYASYMGGAQRLPNGNTLVCGGPLGTIFEVTPGKEVVWEFLSPFYFKGRRSWHNMMFRAYRYGPEHEGLNGRILDPNAVEFTLREKTRRKR